MSSRSLLIALLLSSGASAALAQSDSTLSRRDLALLNRVSWGETASAEQAMASQGAQQWLDGQLHPRGGDRQPQQAQEQIRALMISQVPMEQLVVEMDAQNKAANQITDPDQKKAAQQAYQQAMNDLGRQAATRSLLRDLYSPDQLQAQMTWFWFNHFNVHMYKRDIRAMVGDYEDRAIRPHALGRFRDLLEATLRHPAMLRYLDNDQNAAGHINENYAREIMELHTMGVGSGYSQQDVQELARILTGVGVNTTLNAPKLPPQRQDLYIRNGLFEFNPNRHDFGDKVFLGHTIRGRGYDEVREALDILCREPATAHHVSLELATYFIGDDPPPRLVERMAQTFQASDGDSAKVLQTLFASREFEDSLKRGVFKDPVHYAVSAVRLAYDQRVILNAQPLQNWLNRMAEGLYNHETPDGYPMSAAAWNGPGQMAVRFEIAHQLGAGAPALFRPDGAALTAPPPPPPVPEIQTTLARGELDPSLGGPTKAALSQASSPRDWNALYLSSPEFMRR